MASVRFAQVQKAYDDVQVIQGIDLDIQDGEFLVLVGPSGCGKSTCMRMVAGLETVTAGDILIDERRINDVPPKDRGIGMVFQSYALYPHMTVFDNIAFGLTIRKMSKSVIEQRVQEVAETLGLEELLARKPAQLSGGQRQRVAMGRAIARQPDVFLFDEPLSNLDSALRVRMRAELAALHREHKTTTIYVTHDQVEAMTLADRICVLHQGALQQVGTPDQLFSTPANKFVAQFIGSPSMNVLGPVTIEHTDQGKVARHQDMTFPLPDGRELDGVVEIGFRPNDVAVADDEHPACFVGTVTAIERMGWETYTHLDTPAGTVIVRIEGERGAQVKLGEALPCYVWAGRLHLFDAQGAAR